MYHKFLSFSTLSVIINILLNLINLSEGGMICRQVEFGVIEILHCPNTGNIDLSYCCINNGRVSCCSYEDYKERHSGPSFSTLVALGVSHMILLPALVYYWYKRRRREQQKQEEG
ncbi:hypothetical protein LSTR_LSTR007494 [Laodelphax striatellus]|uniref:Uncharacterized protein n=1 Tax=Laodelphax striatellus TaxID=195883 RepID=A0A482X5Q2_LAOST|nr:hypothetical protein LSTR_LSTR007494 [Laodelphax striatellus]